LTAQELPAQSLTQKPTSSNRQLPLTAFETHNGRSTLPAGTALHGKWFFDNRFNRRMIRSGPVEGGHDEGNTTHSGLRKPERFAILAVTGSAAIEFVAAEHPATEDHAQRVSNLESVE
jgi:hypothetical protein